MNRVLHLRSSCGLYGADRALIDLADATSSPFEAVVGSIVRPDRVDELGNEARKRGLATLQIQSRGKADFDSARWLANQVRTEGIRLLHAHDYKSLSIAALVSARTRIPVVATFHGDTAASRALKVYEALARVLGNVTRGCAAVSTPLAQKLRRWVHTAPVHHVPNGIRLSDPCSSRERAEARAAFSLPPDAQVIAVVGRLSPEKGHAVLFRALQRMANPPVVLVAGDGELAESLKAQAGKLDVRWLGFVRASRPVFAAADLVVMPSLTEGLPLVALEAMSAGRALVASAVGELPTLLREDAGWLVPVGADGALAEAMKAALSSDGEREQRASRALARVRGEYGLDRMADRYARWLYAPAIGALDLGMKAVTR